MDFISDKLKEELAVALAAFLLFVLRKGQQAIGEKLKDMRERDAVNDKKNKERDEERKEILELLRCICYGEIRTRPKNQAVPALRYHDERRKTRNPKRVGGHERRKPQAILHESKDEGIGKGDKTLEQEAIEFWDGESKP